VQPAEQANRDVPPDLADDGVDGGLVGEPAADVGVEPRPAALAGVRLAEERLC
jgi:hypothetical protein